MSIFGAVLVAPVFSQKIYWAGHGSDGGTISRANLDGSEIETIVQFGPDQPPVAIALDLRNEKVYCMVSDYVEFLTYLRRLDLDGGDVEDLLVVSGRMYGLALDVHAGLVYFSEPGRIGRARLDGTQREVVCDPTQGAVNNLAIDVPRQKLYWTDTQGGRIGRVNTDGSDIEWLSPSGFRYPRQIDVDSPGETIYWAAAGPAIGQKWVLAADLDGGSSRVVVEMPLAGVALGVAVVPDGGWMYWSDWNGVSGRIWRGRLDGTEPELITTLDHNFSLALPLAIDLGCTSDTDGDGVCDERDNCPSTPNSDQANSDSDELGDVCDACITSDLSARLKIGSCKTDVANQRFPDGCSMADALHDCASLDADPNSFDNCIAKLTTSWFHDGFISIAELREIRRECE